MSFLQAGFEGFLRPVKEGVTIWGTCVKMLYIPVYARMTRPVETGVLSKSDHRVGGGQIRLDIPPQTFNLLIYLNDHQKREEHHVSRDLDKQWANMRDENKAAQKMASDLIRRIKRLDRLIDKTKKKTKRTSGK